MVEYFRSKSERREAKGHRLSRRRFEQLVAGALKGLPEEFRRRLDNVAVIVKDKPSAETLTRQGLGTGETLLGLYEGIPLTDRTSAYGLVLPDRLTIFQQPIEEMCRTEAEIKRQVQRTVIHEVGHFFGISDAELERLGWG